MTRNAYSVSEELPIPYERAVERVREELAAEGFGVLTEIDVKATLKKKLDVDFQRYVILGACNPQMAHRALQKEPDIGALLPCNVVVHEHGEGSRVVVFDPVQGLGLAGNAELEPIGREVAERMLRVLERLGAG